MKGTVYAKLGNMNMAEKSWSRALSLEPNNQVLRNSLKRVRKRLNNSYNGNPSQGDSPLGPVSH